jgi:hypothetical protein
MIKPRRMRWAGNAAWTVRGRREMHSVLMGKTVRKKHLENIEVDRIILKWILNSMTWCGAVWLKIGTADGLL